MTNATGLREAAEALKDHAWLERFRKASYQNKYHELSPSCANQISGYVDDFLNKVLSAHPASEEPITEGWLLKSLRFEEQPGGTMFYRFEKSFTIMLGKRGSQWEVHFEGSLASVHVATFTTRPQLLHLLAALGCDVQQPTNSGKAG